jgi:hypothetical protein
MASDVAPRPPLGDWPIQGQISFGFIWYTAPAAIVTQVLIDRATLAHAIELTDTIDRIIAARSDDIAALGGALIVHDWKAMRSYDPQGRNHIFSRTRARPPGEVRAVIVSLTLTPLVRMSLEAGNALLRATTGRIVEVVPSIAPVLTRYSVRRPAPGSRLPGSTKSLYPPTRI